jgi:DNA-binding transcriptional LysR family regulator
VLPPPGGPQRQTVEKALAKAGQNAATVVAEADSWSQMLYFAALGVGVCIVNGCVTLDDNLVGRPITDLPEVTYSAIHQPARNSDPAVGQVLDALRTGMP